MAVGETSVSLEYRWIQGRQDRPILVLLHEGLGCVDLWKDFPDQLARATQCSVFVYSRMGYGKSSARRYSFADEYMHLEAGLLFEVIQHLPDDQSGSELVLIGHSDGASIATIFAGHPQVAESRDDAAKVNQLVAVVLLAPHFFVESVSLTGIQMAKRAYLETDLRTKLEKYHGDQVDRVFWDWNDIWLSADFTHWDISDSLSAITVPVLLMQGEIDEYGSVKQVDVAKQRMDQSSSDKDDLLTVK